jgi:hypothetical protein
MQVKDTLQTLQDESLIRMEKIGSGNWYWCFMSDAKNGKSNQINILTAEAERLLTGIKDGEKGIEMEMSRRDDEEMLGGDGVDRKTLLEQHEMLLKEQEGLDKELAAYSDADPAELKRKIEQVCRLKRSAEIWTDNIESLESFLGNTIGLDRTQVAGLMEQCCGEEYVVGEGLKELCGP